MNIKGRDLLGDKVQIREQLHASLRKGQKDKMVSYSPAQSSVVDSGKEDKRKVCAMHEWPVQLQ